MLSFYGIFSQQLDISDLVAELKQQIRAKEPIQLAMIYCTHQYAHQELLDQLADLLQGAPSLGMQAPALLVDEQVHSQGVLIVLWTATDVSIAIGVSDPEPLSDLASGQSAVANAHSAFLNAEAQLPIQSICVLCHPGRADCSQLLQGAVLEAGSGPVWVGAACESERSAALIVNYQWTPAPIVVALFRSTRPFVSQIVQGLTPLGASALVSQSKGAVISSLNYQSALSSYGEMAKQDGFLLDLKDFAGFACHHPLGLPLASGHYLIRTPQSYDHKGQIHCLGSVATHSVWQLMSCHHESLIQAGKESAQHLQTLIDPSGVLLWANQSRLQALGRRAIDSLSAVSQTLQPKRVLGCVSTGEIASLEGGVPQFHNHSLALWGITCATKP